MDWGSIRDILTIPTLILTLLTAFFAWVTSGSKKNTEEIREIRTSLADQDRKLQTFEDTLKHLPDKDVVHRLELGMKDMQIQMASMATSQANTERTARRVEEFLLTHGTVSSSQVT